MAIIKVNSSSAIQAETILSTYRIYFQDINNDFKELNQSPQATVTQSNL